MADESQTNEDSFKGTILTGKELNKNGNHGTVLVTSTSDLGENQPLTANNPEDSLRLEHSNSPSYTSKSGDPLMFPTKESAEDKSKSKSENSDSCSRNFVSDHSDSERNKKDPEKPKSEQTSKNGAKKIMATDKTSHKQQPAKAVPFTRTQVPATKAPSPGSSNRAHSSRAKKRASPKSWRHSKKSSKKLESFVAPRISPSWHAHPKYSPKELTYTPNERSSPQRSLTQGTGQSIGGPVVCPMIRVSRFSKLACQGQRSVYPQPMLLYWNPARQGNISKMDEKRMNAKLVCRVANCLMHASILTVNLQSHSLYILIDHDPATDTLNVS